MIKSKENIYYFIIIKMFLIKNLRLLFFLFFMIKFLILYILYFLLYNLHLCRFTFYIFLSKKNYLILNMFNHFNNDIKWNVSSTFVNILNINFIIFYYILGKY